MPTVRFPIARSEDDVRLFHRGPAYPPDGSGGSVFETGGMETLAGNDLDAGVYMICDALFRWDTSSLPDNATITDATLVADLRDVRNADGRNEVWDFFDWNGKTQSEVINGTGVTPLTTTALSTVSTVVGTRRNIVLNGAAAGVSKTGFTYLRGRVDGGVPTGYNRSAYAAFDSTSFPEPELVVDYTVPDPVSPVPQTGPIIVAATAGANVTVARPNRSGSPVTPVKVGDTIVAVVSGSSVATPAGWTLQPNSSDILKFFTRTVAANEPASYTFTAGVVNSMIVGVFAVWDTSGVKATAPQDFVQDARTVNAPTGFGGADRPNDLAVWAGAFTGSDAAGTLPYTAQLTSSVARFGGGNSGSPTNPSRAIGVFKKTVTTDFTSAEIVGSTTNSLARNLASGFIVFGTMVQRVGPHVRTDHPRAVFSPTLRIRSAKVGALVRRDHPRASYDPRLRIGSVRVSPAFRDRTERATFAPRINNRQLAFHERQRFLYAVTIRPQRVTVRPVFLNRSRSAYAPSLKLVAIRIRPNTTNHPRTVYDPRLRLGKVTTRPSFGGRAPQVFGPALRIGKVFLKPFFHSRNAVQYGVRLSGQLTAREKLNKEAKILGLELSGERGTLHYTPRLFLSNVYGEELRPLPGVESASVDLSNFRDNTWSIQIDVDATDAFDPARDFVLAAMDFRAGRGKSYRFPLGLYRFFLPAGEDEPAGSSWSLEGESLEFLVMRDMATKGFSVPAGSGVLATVKSILTSKGVPPSRITLPSSDKTIKNGLYFDPMKDAEGSYWIRIINSLLSYGGFGALQTDASGQFKTSKTVSVEEKEPTVFYGPSHLGGDDMLISQPIPRAANYDRFANEIFVYSQDVNSSDTDANGNPVADSPAIFSVARNTDPNSPVSIPTLGYTVSKTVQMETVPDQETADLLAKAELARASAYQMVRDISTMPDPRRREDEVYRAEAYNVNGERVMEGKWSVVGWSLDLSEEPQEMKHQVSRTEGF